MKELAHLQAAAGRALATSARPPQRYGTAFHLTPPVTDVRDLPLRPRRTTLTAWSSLDREDRARIAALDITDPYTAWQVAHSDQTATLIHLLPGATGVQTIRGSGLWWVVLEAGSRLTLLDDASQSSPQVRRLFVWQKADSHLSVTATRHHADFITDHTTIELIGRGARADITHLVLGKERQQIDTAVSVVHQAPLTESRLTVRTAAADHAVAMYRGCITISPAAIGSSGYQQGQALLLSRRAVVDILPQLAIHTHDVRCSHGVTTTHLDDHSLFYLRSRGLSETAARALAVRGFYHHRLKLPSRVAKTVERMVATLYDSAA